MRKRIWVLESESDRLVLEKHQLERSGFEVRTVSSLDDAEELLWQRCRGSWLLADGEDSFSLLRWTRERFAHVRMVLVMRETEPQRVYEAYGAGASAVLVGKEPSLSEVTSLLSAESVCTPQSLAGSERSEMPRGLAPSLEPQASFAPMHSGIITRTVAARL